MEERSYSFKLRERNDSETVLLREKLFNEEMERDRTAFEQEYEGVNAVDKANLFSKLFFRWVNPVLSRAKKHQIDIDELGQVSPKDDVREQKARLEENWNFYQRTSYKDHKLYWAVISTYKWEFFAAIFWNLIIATF